MNDFEFSGSIQLGRETQPFRREVEANSFEHGKDKVYAELGSEHSVSRSRIEIEEGEEI
jgi:ribosomal protein L20A (L18A)